MVAVLPRIPPCSIHLGRSCRVSAPCLPEREPYDRIVVFSLARLNQANPSFSNFLRSFEKFLYRLLQFWNSGRNPERERETTCSHDLVDSTCCRDLTFVAHPKNSFQFLTRTEGGTLLFLFSLSYSFFPPLPTRRRREGIRFSSWHVQSQHTLGCKTESSWVLFREKWIPNVLVSFPFTSIPICPRRFRIEYRRDLVAFAG